MYRLKDRCLLLLAMTLWLPADAASLGMAQERQVRGYVLTKVLTGHDPKGVGPTLVEADAEGGKVVVQIRYRGEQIEKTTYEWKLDRDIRFLPSKSRFTQTTTVTVSGNSDRNPFAFPHGGFHFLRTRLSPEELGAGSATSIADPPRSEGEQRIYGKKMDSLPRVGTASDRFEAETERASQLPYMHLSINLNATSRQEHYLGEILYLFRAVYTDTPPGNEPIDIDSPRRGAPTTVKIPPGQPTPGTPPASAGVPCLDPTFDVAYDASVIEPQGNVVKGGLLQAARLEGNDQKRGLVVVAFVQTTPLGSDGIVANLPFRVVGSAGERTPLTLRVSDIDDVKGNPLPIQLVNGEVIIQDPGQGTRCDCDGDGKLTVADAICALKMAVDLMPLDMKMDFNRDGQVTSGDARAILQAIP